MEILNKIPFAFNLAELMKKVRVEPDSADGHDFKELVEKARGIASPKVLYKDCFIEVKGEETIIIEGITFTSRTLRVNTGNIDRVFPFVCTCGMEMEKKPFSNDDLLREYWWDTLKEALLRTGIAYFVEHLQGRYLIDRSSAMAPGSGDADVWPIQQQKELFSLLDGVTKLIGVVLTDSFLMVPNKTISGIRFPAERDFRTCQVCHREVCPNRSALFDEALWRSLQHD